MVAAKQHPPKENPHPAVSKIAEETAWPMTSGRSKTIDVPMPPDGSLLWSDEPEMESSLHFAQIALLVACLEWLWRDRDDFFAGANLTVYYSAKQIKTRDFRGPDFFLVTNTERKPRLSWVIWEEDGRYPDLVIEILSDSTAEVDRTTKKQLYQNTWRLPEYFWFSPITLELEGFRLGKKRYQKISPNAAGLLWSEVLGMFLGIHEGKLRYFDAQSQLLLTPEEAAIQAEQQNAEAQQTIDQLREKLKAAGIDPDAT
jgi:Uma2 family endonuclease